LSSKAELYQAPLGEFIAERKRMAKDDKSLAKLSRPTVSAWAVNQLWWHARDAFDALLASAEKLRKGDLRATAAHRDALAKLRARAKAMIDDAGHATTEATLRRVTQTLSAIAAGGWEPDEPGTIAADRDPPGFGVPGLEAGEKVADAAPAASPAKQKKDQERRAAERHRLEAALRTAKGDVQAREREVTHLERELDQARGAVEKARAIAADLEKQLSSREE
jgi:hypothetical protein